LEFHELLSDLRALEREMIGRSRPSIMLEVRTRVLAEVESELHRERVSAWQFIASAAAVMLLGVNLAMSSAFDSRLQTSVNQSPDEFRQFSRIREQSLEWTDDGTNRKNP
jgi:hypothetical protein